MPVKTGKGLTLPAGTECICTLLELAVCVASRAIVDVDLLATFAQQFLHDFIGICGSLGFFAYLHIVAHGCDLKAHAIAHPKFANFRKNGLPRVGFRLPRFDPSSRVALRSLFVPFEAWSATISIRLMSLPGVGTISTSNATVAAA